MSTEPAYMIIAKRDSATGSPLLGDCIIHTGYGSVQLTAGTSSPDVPETVALALKERGDIMVVKSEDVVDSPSPRAMPEDTAAVKLAEAQAKMTATQAAVLVATGQAMQASDAGMVKLQGPNGIITLTQEQITALALQQLEQAAAGPDADRIAAAQEHLREEGMEAPDLITPTPAPEPAAAEPVAPAPTVAEAGLIPTGFEAALPDGRDRCLAAKADGTQCLNAAVSNSACALAPHQEQRTQPAPAVAA